MSSRQVDRRQFLRGLGGISLALPFLGLSGRARAGAPSAVPKRLLVVVHRQGVVMEQWLPSGDEFNFTFPQILTPLDAWKDRLVVIAGLDNKVPAFNTAGNGHENASTSILTCQRFANESAATLAPAGPSFEQVIADRIGAGTPYRRLDLSIGGGGSGSGYQAAAEFYYGANDPVSMIADPILAFNRLFGGNNVSAETLAAIRARRASVLDAVLQNFNQYRTELDAEGKVRLDAHADKLRQLEQRVTGAAATGCAAPQFSLPAGYNFAFDDNVSAAVQIDILVAAMACAQTHVGTLLFAQGHDPTFPWLNVGGGPVVPTSIYDNWHAMVHDGRDEPGLVVGFQWYAQQFAYLLEALDRSLDMDGDNMLDTSLVLWISDFGNGAGHNTNKIPVILAGNTGPLGNGRFLSQFMSGGADADWTAGSYSTNQLFVSLLNLFGQPDTTFGFTDPRLPDGPLPGLLV